MDMDTDIMDIMDKNGHVFNGQDGHHNHHTHSHGHDHDHAHSHDEKKED